MYRLDYASALAFLLSIATLQPALATDYDIKSTSLYGLRLGMTAAAAMVALKKDIPNEHIRVYHGVCERDYTAALKANQTSATNSCITAITVSNSSRSFLLGLVEDLTHNHYGQSIVTFIRLDDNTVKTDSDRAAFLGHAKQRFGKPDTGADYNYTAWCSGESSKVCVAPDIFNAEDTQFVRVNETPYGYCATRSTADFPYAIGVHTQQQGIVILADSATPLAVCYQFSQAVNPQTSKPGF